MGAVASAVMGHGGKVTGIIPKFLLEKEQPLRSIELIETDDIAVMAERKTYFFTKASGIVILPGGMGTLDEYFEGVTLEQLDRIKPPSVLVNIAGFYDYLLAHLDRAREEGFVRPGLDFRQLVVTKVEDIIPKLFEQIGIPATNIVQMKAAS